MTLDNLRERLDQDVPEGKLGGLPATYTWAPLLQVALMSNSILSGTMGFAQPQGVILAGAPGNGRHSTAYAIVNSRGRPYLWLNGWDLDDERYEDTKQTLLNLARLASEQKGLTLLLDTPENSRHNTRLQEGLFRILSKLPAGILFPVMVTGQPESISPALRRLLLTCPFACPNKSERDTWLKQQLEEPVPLKIENMDRSELVTETEGFSWQQLQELIRHLKLMVFRKAVDRQKEFAQRDVTLERAIKTGLVPVSSTAARILLDQLKQQSPQPAPAPTVQVIGVAADPNTVSHTASQNTGKSREELLEDIQRFSRPEDIDPNELLNLDW